MNKKEYLEKLKSELTLLSSEDVKKVIRSYRVKINTMINKGMSESDTLRTLGTPSNLAKKIYKEKGIKVPKEKSGKSLKDNLKINLEEIKSNKEKDKKKKIETKKETPQKKKEEKPKKVKEKKNLFKKKEGITEVIPSIEEKKEKKKISKKNEIKEVIEVIPSLEEAKEVEIKEEKKQEIVIEDIKTVMFKQVLNLIALMLALVLMYYPFKLVNTYAMLFLGKINLGVTVNLFFNVVIYTLYLIVCISALTHYLSYISEDRKVIKVNKFFEILRKIILILLEIPMMLFVLVIAAIFFMACFLFLDGVRIIGMPIAFFGLLLFVLMVYIALRNKVNNKKRSIFYSFITYLVPLLIMGLGFGMSYRDIIKYENVYDVDKKYTYKLFEKDYTLPEDGEYRINFNTNYKTKYNLVKDKKLKGNTIRVQITYYKDYYNLKTITDKESLYISLSASPRRKVSIFLENIKDGEIYSVDELERYEVTIYYGAKVDQKKLVIEN